MKRFNIDELIWFIILCLLNISIIYLIKSDTITNFVDEDMIKYFYISIVIILFFSIFQFKQIFTLRNRKEKTNKFMPITFTLIVGVILLFVIPSLSISNDDIINNMKKKYESAITIDNENYEIILTKENEGLYKGKLIMFQGYVALDSKIDNVQLCRELITCCQQDKRQITIQIKGIDENLKEGQWIVVVGQVVDEINFTIDAIEYKIINKPTDIYFHEHL